MKNLILFISKYRLTMNNNNKFKALNYNKIIYFSIL